MTEWINVNDRFPDDAEPVWVLNKEKMQDWEHEFIATQYKYMIYDAFFERCQGWVFLDNAPNTRKNICYWAHRNLPKDLRND